ncbi:MAG: FtsX-like permease family protein [Gemmatimonadales bacterium]|nr:FtsX-like permease family protein [Gemmatimonadales bacterium]MDZ4389966.1 FtsX-like permease family protein [Gemmatimonadales bacterium]
MHRLLLALLLFPVTLLAQEPIGVALERRLAEQLRLDVGDSLTVAREVDGVGRTARVEAIYEPRADPATIMRQDYRIRLHLPDAAELLGTPDRVDRIGLAVMPGVDPRVAAEQLERTAFGYDLIPTAEVAAESSTTFLVVSRFHRAIAIISILASAIFLLCLMLLKIEARKLDVAMLRFTGISRRTVAAALILEATVIASVGSVVGAVLAAGASAVVNWHYRRLFDTTLLFSLLSVETVLWAVGLSLLLGIATGAIAAWRLVRQSPLALWGRAG